jgi:hypothetical protein
VRREPQAEPHHESFLANNAVGHAAASDNTCYVPHSVTAAALDGHDAPLLGAAATVVRYTLNGRILLVILFPRDTATVTALDS